MTSVEIKQFLSDVYNSGEWLFVDELRNGSGYTGNSNGYMDGFAINCFPSRGFERVAFEIKVSRADFTREIRKPLKRKIALLYSNKFYFVTPVGVLKPEDIPVEAGLLEIATRQKPLHWKPTLFTHPLFEVRETVPAPWRDTPPPSWSLFASMGRRLRKLGPVEAEAAAR